MRRPAKLAVVIATAALAATACTANGEQPPAAEPTAPTGPAGPTATGPTATGPTATGPTGGNQMMPPENEPPPEVEPSVPPKGADVPVEFNVESRGTSPDDTFSRPQVILVRNEAAEATAAQRSPSREAADRIRAWSDYGNRAVLAVFGGAQPDAAHSVKVDLMSVRKQGKELVVAITISARGGGGSAQVVSVPWLITTVPANAVAAVRTCIVGINQQALPSDC